MSGETPNTIDEQAKPPSEDNLFFEYQYWVTDYSEMRLEKPTNNREGVAYLFLQKKSY